MFQFWLISTLQKPSRWFGTPFTQYIVRGNTSLLNPRYGIVHLRRSLLLIISSWELATLVNDLSHVSPESDSLLPLVSELHGQLEPQARPPLTGSSVTDHCLF